ncbi:hypothetical protein, partial [Kitasatospora sp. NPDC059571]|uniref:hypothetical protein n=1 Tax=Kitasatospora sp. NPDC059571 TaxID=3346871 RepID=UPI0036778F93
MQTRPDADRPAGSRRTAPARSALARRVGPAAVAVAAAAVLAGTLPAAAQAAEPPATVTAEPPATVTAASTPQAPRTAPAAAGAAAPLGPAAPPAVDVPAVLAELAPAYRDCPPLPAGADPARWRCEVHRAAPELTLGAVRLPALAPIVMVHAEGPLPDGSPGQVWGTWRSGGPTPVPGGLTGTPAGDRSRLLGLSLEAGYGGRPDFYTGTLSLRFRLSGPLLPAGCTVGAEAPVDIALKRSGPSEWLSRTPPLIRFAAYDDAFTAPAPQHCGPLGGLLGRRLGLPAQSGNLLRYDAVYTFRMYDRLDGCSGPDPA